jgi:nucleoside phosphorylase/CheY-like chemotaxis protein
LENRIKGSFENQMKILLLEDCKTKIKQISEAIADVSVNTTVSITECYSDFIGAINREDFDLIVADLMLPMFNDSSDEFNITSKLIENLRDVQCQNYNTPVIAVTKFDELAEENFSELNKFDINIITYNSDSSDWVNPFRRKVESCIPVPSYDFVIVCALDKEAEAFKDCGFSVGNEYIYEGITCKSIDVKDKKGVIVVPPRMGLVNSAIISSRVIDLFKPQLICMSGICAGIEGNANIYDVVIPEICHQHDSGKWTNNGFVTESYAIQLDHNVRQDIASIIKESGFKKVISEGVVLGRNEFPDGEDKLKFNVYLAPTSSGSAVVADETMLAEITSQHRKATAFEMESYAMYEAARQSNISPKYFSAKSVVDNGNTHKGDEYHRVACLLSAKTVYELISKILTEK